VNSNPAADTELARLRALRGGPRDGALLRMTLAHALLARQQTTEALDELRAALAFDPEYSAAWKLLGKTLAAQGAEAAARDAYRAGIEAAARRGDKQAEKEMRVFLRRLERGLAAGS
jgi:Tfp pilus assembly protein PilF